MTHAEDERRDRRAARLRRPGDRRRRRRPARRDRGARAGHAHRDHLQVAVRQGAHGDGRGRRRGGDGQRQQQRQLAGPLPRHHARRQVPQQLADGRAAREGGAGPGLGAGDLRRAVRPHQGRQDQPAQLRRPRVPAAGARRRPHRPGADPHPAAEDRLAAAGGRRATTGDYEAQDQGLRRVHGHRAAQGRTTRIAGAFGYWRENGRFLVVRRAGGHPGHRRHRQVVQGHQQLAGSTPATGTPWRCARARR